MQRQGASRGLATSKQLRAIEAAGLLAHFRVPEHQIVPTGGALRRTAQQGAVQGADDVGRAALGVGLGRALSFIAVPLGVVVDLLLFPEPAGAGSELPAHLRNQPSETASSPSDRIQQSAALNQPQEQATTVVPSAESASPINSDSNAAYISQFEAQQALQQREWAANDYQFAQQQQANAAYWAARQNPIRLNGKQDEPVEVAVHRGANPYENGESATEALERSRTQLLESVRQQNALSQTAQTVVFTRKLPGSEVSALSRFTGNEAELRALLEQGRLTQQDLDASGVNFAALRAYNASPEVVAQHREQALETLRRDLLYREDGMSGIGIMDAVALRGIVPQELLSPLLGVANSDFNHQMHVVGWLLQNRPDVLAQLPEGVQAFAERLKPFVLPDDTGYQRVGDAPMAPNLEEVDFDAPGKVDDRQPGQHPDLLPDVDLRPTDRPEVEQLEPPSESERRPQIGDNPELADSGEQPPLEINLQPAEDNDLPHVAPEEAGTPVVQPTRPGDITARIAITSPQTDYGDEGNAVYNRPDNRLPKINPGLSDEALTDGLAHSNDADLVQLLPELSVYEDQLREEWLEVDQRLTQAIQDGDQALRQQLEGQLQHLTYAIETWFYAVYDLIKQRTGAIGPDSEGQEAYANSPDRPEYQHIAIPITTSPDAVYELYQNAASEVGVFFDAYGEEGQAGFLTPPLYDNSGTGTHSQNYHLELVIPANLNEAQWSELQEALEQVLQVPVNRPVERDPSQISNSDLVGERIQHYRGDKLTQNVINNANVQTLPGQQQFADSARQVLAELNENGLDNLTQLNRYRYHPLTGGMAGYESITFLSGSPYRIVFTRDAQGNFVDVHIVDYH